MIAEITDDALASIYSNLSSCSPLVRGLAERLRRVEKENEVLTRWLDAYKMGYQVNVEDKDHFAARAYRTEDAYQELATENSALREKMKRMEEALQNMLDLWERVHGGAVVGRPTVNAAKKTLGGVEQW